MDPIETAAQVAKKLPAEALVKLTNTACATFEQVLAPATALGGGVGRLIEETFNDLSKLRKIYASHILKRAKEKLKGTTISRVESPATIIEVITAAGTATDPSLQELWANLLARELTTGGIHPEIPRALSRLTSEDAQLLTKLKVPASRITVTPISSFFGTDRADKSRTLRQPKTIFWGGGGETVETPSHWILISCGLARQSSEGAFYLTTLGQAFLAAVADPDAEGAAENEMSESLLASQRSSSQHPVERKSWAL